MALDGAGNLYIADTFNHRIRKVTSSSGNISTVAGSGTAGFGGDGGSATATAAKLYSPRGVALDGSGNLYIADCYNHRIRKVDSSGNISTVAGSGTAGFGGDGGSATATAAKLHYPSDVTLDGAGNLYIADWGNHRIRKVTSSSGNISTVAGNGTHGFGGDGGSATATAAKLYYPRGVALDSAGNLYIADQLNHRIRKVDSVGVITTVAGTGAYGGDAGSFGGDGGSATATAAKLNYPSDVTLDGAGNLYIADGYNNRIRKVDSSGNISTVAGGGAGGVSGDGGAATAARLNYPQGVALDGSGNLYIPDTANHSIRKVDSSGNISTVAGTSGDGAAATAALLNRPTGVALDGAGNLYIADWGNNRIRKVDSSGNISTVAGTGTWGFSGDGGPATEAQLREPLDVALDGAGNLYIADTINQRIRKVDSSGVITTVAGSGTYGYVIHGFSGEGVAATEAQLYNPSGVALDGAGNLYIADTHNLRIRKVDTAGVITTVAGDGTQNYGGDGGPAVAAQLWNPSAVALDGSGNLYIADSVNNRIRKVDTAGVITTVAGSSTTGGFGGDGGPATAAQLRGTFGVALDGSGNLYIADWDNNRIRKVDTAGMISTVAGDGTRGFGGDGGAATAAQLYRPQGVALDGSGNLYIADTDNNRIRKVGPRALRSTIDLPPPPIVVIAPDPSRADPPVTGPAPAPRPREPAVHARTLELVFVLRQDDAPAAQQVVLYAESGDVDFRAQPAQRWLAVEPASGSLEEDEEAAVTVTVDPAGLRVGRREGLVYVRSGERVTERVRIALTVQPAAGPAVSENGVVNAAVLGVFGDQELFGPRLLPPAPGSMVAVLGENFADTDLIVADRFPLPLSLGGASVKFNGLAARLFAVGPRRIYAQLPSLLGRETIEAGGTALATVVVETAAGSSYPRRFWTGPHGPGIFTMSGGGTGQAAAVLAGTTVLAAPPGFSGNIRLAQPGEPVNIYTTSRPARAGDVLEIYATGLGSVEPPLADGENSCAPDGVCLADGSNVVLRRTAERPRVSIGGVEVAADGVLFSGLAPTLAAVDMLLVKVPAGIAPSAAAEVVIAVGGRASQPGVTIAVE